MVISLDIALYLPQGRQMIRRVKYKVGAGSVEGDLICANTAHNVEFVVGGGVAADGHIAVVVNIDHPHAGLACPGHADPEYVLRRRDPERRPATRAALYDNICVACGSPPKPTRSTIGKLGIGNKDIVGVNGSIHIQAPDGVCRIDTDI